MALLGRDVKYAQMAPPRLGGRRDTAPAARALSAEDGRRGGDPARGPAHGVGRPHGCWQAEHSPRKGA